MKKKHLVVFIYLVLALGFFLDGLVMLLAPAQWFHAAPLPLDKSVAPFYLVQLLGVAEIAFGFLFFWCTRNLKKRKPVHFALTVCTVGTAAVTVMEIAVAPVIPAAPSFWIPVTLAVFLPAFVMVLMALPPLPARVKGPRELGRVKWFNATKGFGFITRE